MLDDFPLTPSWLKLDGLVDTMPISMQYYVGPAGSGAPLHYHCDAWNALAFGRKRWFLQTPADAVFSNRPVSQWLNSDNVTGTALDLQCIQKALSAEMRARAVRH